MSVANVSPVTIPADALLQHWQGHRRLTRRAIDVFPEDQLFSYSLGGMRDFGTMTMEVISIAAPMVRGIVTENWEPLPSHEPGERHSKRHLLQLWDDSTTAIDEWWPKLTPARFLEMANAFGQYPGRVYDLLLYAIDNEVHHRGQGYVYLRSLGIAPPPFYERE